MYIITAVLLIIAVYVLSTPTMYFVIRMYYLSVVVTVQSAERTPEVSATNPVIINSYGLPCITKVTVSCFVLA